MQSGGTNSVSNLNLGYYSGSSGTYSLSGSGSLWAYGEYVGLSGTGTFTQSGGTNSCGSLTLGSSAAAAGRANLNGGLLVLAALDQGPGAATFDFNGGTLQASSALASSLCMTLGGRGATFDTAGYLVQLFGSLSGPGSLTKVDSGTLILSGPDSYHGGTIGPGRYAGIHELQHPARRVELDRRCGRGLGVATALPRAPRRTTAVPGPGALVLLAAALGVTAAYRHVRIELHPASGLSIY